MAVNTGDGLEGLRWTNNAGVLSSVSGKLGVVTPRAGRLRLDRLSASLACRCHGVLTRRAVSDVEGKRVRGREQGKGCYGMCRYTHFAAFNEDTCLRCRMSTTKTTPAGTHVVPIIFRKAVPSQQSKHRGTTCVSLAVAKHAPVSASRCEKLLPPAPATVRSRARRRGPWSS